MLYGGSAKIRSMLAAGQERMVWMQSPTVTARRGSGGRAGTAGRAMPGAVVIVGDSNRGGALARGREIRPLNLPEGGLAGGLAGALRRESTCPYTVWPAMARGRRKELMPHIIAQP